MPTTQGGRFAKNSSTLPRVSLFLSTVLPRSSAPCTSSELLAMSKPMVVACIWRLPYVDSLRFHAGRSRPSAGGVHPTIKAWKSHLAADRTSCPKATANQFLDLPRFRGGVKAWVQGIWSDGILSSCLRLFFCSAPAEFVFASRPARL